MFKFIKKSSKTPGMPPGALVHVGDKKTDVTNIQLFDYGQGKCIAKNIDNLEEIKECHKTESVTWLNITGLHDTRIIEQIGNIFSLHPLVLEDIVNTGHRPKVEEHDDYFFIVLKMLYLDKDKALCSEQVSLILGEHFLITFQEIEGDVFSAVRERIKNGKGRIRKMDCDYLAYALIDAIVDHYIHIMGEAGDQIEMVELELETDPTQQTMEKLHSIKREMLYLRKRIMPVREMLNLLIKSESPLIQEKTVVFFRDVYDHINHVIDTIETFRDLLSSMLDLYLSIVSNRMNEVMKVLTIIATIFIPITFVAGIYGMNFENMPELKWSFGYSMVWIIIGVVTGVMLIYFKRKKWL
ncbi:MAG: magnesium/cobalt transporter CorA [Desulfobacterales bacterium]|nr:magnesium/cobalt transporter CorA [Desulfobacterales bacterium]